MSHKRLARHVVLAAPIGVIQHPWEWPRGHPTTRWSDYISNLAWSHLDVEPAELSEMATVLTVRYFES